MKLVDNYAIPITISLQNLYRLFSNNFSDALIYLKQKFNINFDITINFNFSFLSAIVHSIINSKIKIGTLLFNNREIYVSNKYLKQLFYELDKCKKDEHILNYYFKTLNIFPENFILQNISCNNNIKNIIFHVGANIEKKKWGVENYFNLAKIISKNFDSIKIFLTGTIKEKEDILTLKNMLKKYGITTEDISGKMSYKDLLQLIKDSDLLISSDTSIQHLSALTSTKTVTIFLGGCYHYHTFPYQLNKYVIFPEIECYPCSYKENCNRNFECRTKITPEMIFKAIIEEKIKNTKKTVLKNNLLYLQ